MIFPINLAAKERIKSIPAFTGAAVRRGRFALRGLAWLGVLALGTVAGSPQSTGFPNPAPGSPGPAPGTALVSSSVSGMLRCWPDRPVSKVGEPVKIHVAIVNHGKLPILIRVLFYPVPESEQGAGTPPLKISCYNPVTHFFPYYFSPAERPASTRPVLTKLKPGASVGAMLDLTKFYRLPPGTYNVTLFYSDVSGPPRIGKQFVTTELTQVKSVNFQVVP